MILFNLSPMHCLCELSMKDAQRKCSSPVSPGNKIGNIPPHSHTPIVHVHFHFECISECSYTPMVRQSMLSHEKTIRDSIRLNDDMLERYAFELVQTTSPTGCIRIT